MTESDLDYSVYNLEQLYDIQRRIDQERFPQRYAALQREIAHKHANPDSSAKTRNYPPCGLLTFLGAKPSREVYTASNALNMARTIVSIEYTLFGLILALPAVLVPGFLTLVACFIGMVLYAILFSGVAILNKGFTDIRDEHSVELWSLVALGIAPCSALLYTVIGVLILEKLNYPNVFPPLFMLPAIAGYYTPFTLAVLWVKYHCRDDEF